MRWIAPFLLAGCAGADPDDSGEPAPSTGAISIAFEIDESYLDNLADNGEQASGTFYGSLFYGDEVTGAGPDDGAESLGGLEVEVDLTTGNPSQPLLDVADLPAEVLVILGFLDTDGNAVADAEDPEQGDPVTLPGENKFQVVGGQTTAVTVYFGLLHP